MEDRLAQIEMSQLDKKKIYSIQNDLADNLNLADSKRIEEIPSISPVIAEQPRVEADKHELKSKPKPLKAANDIIKEEDKLNNGKADRSLLGHQEPKARLNGSTHIPTKDQRPHP